MYGNFPRLLTSSLIKIKQLNYSPVKNLIYSDKNNIGQCFGSTFRPRHIYFYTPLKYYSKMASPLEQVSNVDIDAGTFKYILIKVHHSPEGGQETSKFIVRGYCSAAFHGDIYDDVAPNIESKGLDCECVGGGRIKHTPEEKIIEVYGYSQGFGKADHSISVALLKEKYPDYTKITFSNDGY